MGSDGKIAVDADVVARIAAALERLAPAPLSGALPAGDAFVWEPEAGGLVEVPNVAHVDLSLLKGVENQRDTLLANTRRFVVGLFAFFVLLWGVCGLGLSC